MSQGTSFLPKDKGPTAEPGKAIGVKRLQTDTSSGPVYHNVYVRRRVESEHSKVNPSQELKELVPEKTEPPVASSTGIQEEVKWSSIEYWNERFNRLQTYLENCDHSTQEGYLRKLRSLSAAGRNMHAIELEKRAIHLLVEEGKELQRMKALNVLGKVTPNASSKLAPLQR
ncbi:unnamed protein product [Miscanthus lutarioriparius]|uniref:Uncharacterized protein n=1 Tax=Miscanthus lutarioriparius TaxID=422564 RepID=A0A811PQZ5_9POAL|nr:unnamed protein product [Miscanthus lutarioriparius]